MALPYTLALAQSLGSGGTVRFDGAIPVARLDGYSGSASTLTLRLEAAYIAGGLVTSLTLEIIDAAIDLSGELEDGRLHIESSDGATEYWRGVLSASDDNEPYTVPATPAQIQALSVLRNTAIRLRWVSAISPVDVAVPPISVPAPTAAAPQANVAGPLPVDVAVDGISVPAPTATVRAEPHSYPVDVAVDGISVPAPTAVARVEKVTATLLDVSVPAISVPAPSARKPRARIRGPLPVDVSVPPISVPAPTATVRAEPHSYPVDVAVDGISVPAPEVPAPRAEPHYLPVDVSVPAISVPAPTVSAPGIGIQGVTPVAVAIPPITVPAPTVSAPSVQAASAGGFYEEAGRSLSPPVVDGEPLRIVTCIEITHPSAAAPIRLVDDGEDAVIDGVTYRAARFEAATTGDAGERAPRGQIAIGNVGREVSRWIDEADGGAGGQARVFEAVVLGGAGTPEWELTMDIASISVEDNVVLGLGFDPLLGRPAVAMRYDPQTAPGLF